MIAMRKENPILVYGEYNLILENHEQIFAYTRTLDKERFVIICNLTASEVVYEYRDTQLSYEGLMLSNYEVEPHDIKTAFQLKPYEARIYKVI